MIHTRTEAGMNALLIGIIVVGIFVWIFNSYKLGKLNLQWYERMNEKQKKAFRSIIAISLAAIALILLIPLLF